MRTKDGKIVLETAGEVFDEINSVGNNRLLSLRISEIHVGFGGTDRDRYLNPTLVSLQELFICLANRLKKHKWKGAVVESCKYTEFFE